MNSNDALVDKEYLLERFEGKGGWTYAQIPEVLQNKHSPFGWVRVKGSIDGYEIKNYNLMPMGNGRLFLPVKAGIRKQIKKGAGDYVRVILYADNLPDELTDELKLCFEDEPEALNLFMQYSPADQKAFINWIYSAKTEDIKIDRIAKTIDKVLRGVQPTSK